MSDTPDRPLPSIGFYAQLSANIKSDAVVEIDQIEATWAEMRKRWAELRTLIDSIDAAQAVMTGEPAHQGPDIEVSEGDISDLEARLHQLRNAENAQYAGPAVADAS